LRIGSKITPACSFPSRSSAIDTAKCGMPCRKFSVPSSGSTMKRWRLVRALHLAAFLEKVAITRARFFERLADDLFGLLVGNGYEIRRALAGDLQILDFAEITDEATAGGARRIHH